MANLKGKTLFITGASRGIGKAIGMIAAKDGANIVIAAKSADPNPKLPGTIYTAAEEIKAAGGNALPLQVDVRFEQQVQEAIDQSIKTFGGLDIMVNNASAISMTGTDDTAMKRYDLMHNINVRGTFLCSKLAYPHLKKGKNPHILNLSPPLSFDAKWFKDHVAYTIAKFGMSMCTLGMAEEFKQDAIAVNSLWPQTMIATAAMKMIGGDQILPLCRKPEIVADAAYQILTSNSKDNTGNFYIDEEVLKNAGVNDFSVYQDNPKQKPLLDLFLDN